MKNQFLIPACLVSLSVAGSAQAIGVLNDNFDSPSYNSFSFNGSDSLANPDDLSFESFGASPTGGNPDAHGVVTHTHSVERDEFEEPLSSGDAEVQSFFTEQTTTYTPSISGAVESFTFSLDIRTIDFFDSVFFELSDLSGGSVAGGGGGFFTINNDGEWNTYTITVEQSDVPSRDFSGTDPLSFGFGFTSFEDASFADVDYSLDVDNFVVTATLVPEPTSLAVLVGGIGLLARRRRA